METIPDPLHFQAAQTPDRLAFRDGPYRLTYREASALVRREAQRLLSLGVGEGDRVAILSRNSIAFAIALHAIAGIGASAVPLSLRLTALDWKKQAAAATRCKMVLADRLHEAYAQSFGLPVSVLEDEATLEAERDRGMATPSGEVLWLDRENCVVFTSGSKGTPKGVVLTHGNHYYNAVASNENLGLCAEDCWLLSLPLYHVGGLSILHRCVLAGAAVEIVPDFDLEAVVDLMDRGRITHLSVVPTMMQRLIEARQSGPPAGIKAILLGGAPVPATLCERAARSGWPVLTTYGMTETASQIATMAPADGPERLSTCGRPLKTVRVRVVDSEARDVPAGVDGDIVVQGKTVFGGYLRPESGGEPRQRAQSPLLSAGLVSEIKNGYHPYGEDSPWRDTGNLQWRGGWFVTGDRGRLDSSGYLTVTGRADDMFVSGGENIYPGEIETAALIHPGVAGCAVLAVPNREWGKRPILFVETRQGEKGALSDLIAHLKKRLPKLKMPDEVLFVHRLPRTALGKVDYGALERLYRTHIRTDLQSGSFH